MVQQALQGLRERQALVAQLAQLGPLALLAQLEILVLKAPLVQQAQQVLRLQLPAQLVLQGLQV